MKISIIGAGNIGGTLAAKWSRAGHEVLIGVRDPGSPKARNAVQAGEAVTVNTVANGIAFGEIVLFAVPGIAVEPILDEHAGALNGKIVIDATNKVGVSEMSAVPAITVRAPEARVYRAFNTLGWENFAEPEIGGVQADLFYCGHDDSAARPKVEKLIQDTGLRPVYAGGLDQLPVIDHLTRLWFALAHGQQLGRHLAFKMLTP
jgi:predicted dinucleotide-binding enzyme